MLGGVMQTVDIEKARAFIERQEGAERSRLHARFQAAWKDFEGIVDLLAATPAIRRLYQWGSLLDERLFTDRSDIDIAIEGDLDAETFFDLYGKAEALTRFPLDLVELNKIEPIHAASIRRKGRLIYER